jgi:hypothetical protein
MDLDRMGRLAARAAMTDGMFAMREAAAHGISVDQIQRAVTAGVVERLHPNVMRFAGTPLTRRARIRGTSLHLPDGTVSHEASFVLHRVDRIPFALAMTVGPEGSHRHEGIRIHRAGDLLAEHRCAIAGIRTTTVARAVVDVASVLSPSALEYVLDHVTVTRRLVTIGEVARTWRQVNRRGRRGIRNLTRLLEARSPTEPAPRSRLERRADELIARAGLPMPVREHPLPSDGSYRGFVDRAWPQLQLILEIDGRCWHARERAMANDRARDRQSAALAWQTLRILDEEIDGCPEAVVSELIDIYDARRSVFRKSA